MYLVIHSILHLSIYSSIYLFIHYFIQSFSHLLSINLSMYKNLPDASPVTLPTDHHLKPSSWTLPSALSSVTPWPVSNVWICHTHQSASTSYSLVPCTGKPGASSGLRKLRYRRSYEDNRNSLKTKVHFILSTNIKV